MFVLVVHGSALIGIRQSAPSDRAAQTPSTGRSKRCLNNPYTLPLEGAVPAIISPVRLFDAISSGEEKTWSDKYGDRLFYRPIILGMVGSFIAGVWKFLTETTGSAKAISHSG